MAWQGYFVANCWTPPDSARTALQWDATIRPVMQPPQRAPEPVQGHGTNPRARVGWLTAVAVTAALLVLRRPDAVLNPQFRAEDGYWFQQAYNYGAVNSLLSTYTGYFQTLSRLAAVIALSVPLSRAPLVLNLTALLVEALPALFLLSPRMRNLGGLALRCMLALLYLVVPKADEVHASITNAPFNLALLAFLVVIAEAPASRAGRTFDVAVLVLMGLTCPFCILLFPVALLVAAARRQRWTIVRLSVLGGGVIAQGLALLFTGHQRTHQHLGASFLGFCRIVAGQVVLPVLQGRNRLDQLAHSPTTVAVLAWLITALAVVLFLYAIWRGSLELRSFILFALLVLAASLAFPTPNPTNDHWGPMQTPGGAARYWYIPRLALMVTFLWLLRSARPAGLRVLGGVLVCFMTFGATKHWQYGRLPDLHFAGYAQQFEQLPRGSSLKIPINPLGWSITLIKR
jgi:hypothetical protein